MNIRHNDIIIDPENPFLNCKLNRQQYALVLTDIVKNLRNGFVLAIDNEWGTGKTTFVRMWKQYLENNNFKTLYFNAWENDFENDILVTLVSELETLKPNVDFFKELINKAAPLTKSLAIGLLKTQVEKYVGNDFIKELDKHTSDTIIESLHEQVISYKKKKKSVEEFKECLHNFVTSISDEKPVVFIIDELDRCRPNYAVEFLENIKHLFSVSGIVFVLTIDKVQLGNAVKGVYGSDLIDSEEYLRRFFDIEYSIPKPDTKLFTNYLYDYFQFDDFFSFTNRLQYPELNNDKTSFLDFATTLFDYDNFSLRVQEKIFAHARLALYEFASNHYVVPSLFVLLIFLKIKHNKIYLNIKNDTYNLQDLINDVESVLLSTINKKNLRMFLYTEAMLLISYNNAKEYNLKEKLITENGDGSKIKLLIKSRIDISEDNIELAGLINSAKNYHSNIHDMSIKHLIKKIDLTDPIIVSFISK